MSNNENVPMREDGYAAYPKGTKITYPLTADDVVYSFKRRLDEEDSIVGLAAHEPPSDASALVPIASVGQITIRVPRSGAADEIAELHAAIVPDEQWETFYDQR